MGVILISMRFTWLWALVVGIASAVRVHFSAQPDDWASLWIAARMVTDGKTEHLYALDPNDFASFSGDVWPAYAAEISELAPYAHPFVHNPLVAYLLTPLTLLSFEQSVLLLAACNGVAVVAFAAACLKLWGSFDATKLVAASLVIWLSLPLQLSLWIGQTTPIIIALTVVGLALRRPWLAGFLLSCAVLVKLTPVILIPVMLLWRRRAALWAAGWTVAWAIASVVLVPWVTLRDWFTTLRWLGSKTLVAPVNQSVDSIVAQWSEPGKAEMLVEVRDVGEAMVWKLLICAVIAVVFAWAMWSSRQWRYHMAVTVVACTVTAMASIVWSHYTMLAFLPLIGAGVVTRHQWVRIAAMLSVVLLLPPVGEVFDPESTPLAFVGNGLGAMLAGVVIVMVAVGLQKDLKPDVGGLRSVTG